MILVFCHSNAAFKNSERFCHFDISGQSPEERLSDEIEVAVTLGYGRVARKHHASHASIVLLPQPLAAFIAIR